MPRLTTTEMYTPKSAKRTKAPTVELIAFDLLPLPGLDCGWEELSKQQMYEGHSGAKLAPWQKKRRRLSFD